MTLLQNEWLGERCPFEGWFWTLCAPWRPSLVCICIPSNPQLVAGRCPLTISWNVESQVMIATTMYKLLLYDNQHSQAPWSNIPTMIQVIETIFSIMFFIPHFFYNIHNCDSRSALKPSFPSCFSSSLFLQHSQLWQFRRFLVAPNIQSARLRKFDPFHWLVNDQSHLILNLS
jgi:hypothetical protein